MNEMVAVVFARRKWWLRRKKTSWNEVSEDNTLISILIFIWVTLKSVGETKSKAVGELGVTYMCNARPQH
jgi:hypothetical protein